jgi:hypothetical protein
MAEYFQIAEGLYTLPSSSAGLQKLQTSASGNPLPILNA